MPPGPVPGASTPLSPFASLELAPLSRGCLLRSTERRDTYDAIARELCDYGLRWRGGTVEALAFKAQAGRLALYTMQYGDEVDILPDVYRDFVLAHVCLSKSIEVEVDGARMAIGEGQALLCAPRRAIRLRWQQGCQQLILRIPHALLREALPEHDAPPAGRHLPELASGRLVPLERQAQWAAQLNLMLAVSTREATQPSHGAWVELVERGAALFALEQLAPRALAGAGSLDRASEPGTGVMRTGRATATAAARLDRLEAYLRTRLSAPVTMQDLMRTAGVGRSQLHELCRRHLGRSPIGWLRDLRLDAARAHLVAHPEASIADTAQRYGFDHQGRFAAYFRRRFGESPRSARTPEGPRGAG